MPPPADIALRVSMFRSWQVDLTVGMAGVVLNTLIYYVVRFGSPAFGLALLLLLRYEDDGATVFAFASGAVAVLCLVAAEVLADLHRNVGISSTTLSATAIVAAYLIAGQARASGRAAAADRARIETTGSDVTAGEGLGCRDQV